MSAKSIVNDIYDKMINSEFFMRKVNSHAVSANAIYEGFTEVGIEQSFFVAEQVAIIQKAISEDNEQIVGLVIFIIHKLDRSWYQDSSIAIFKSKDAKIINHAIKNGLLISGNSFEIMLKTCDEKTIDILMTHTVPKDITVSRLSFSSTQTNCDYGFNKIYNAAMQYGRLSYERILLKCTLKTEHAKIIFDDYKDLSSEKNKYVLAFIKNSGEREKEVIALAQKYPSVVKTAMENDQTILIPDVLKKIFLKKDKK